MKNLFKTSLLVVLMSTFAMVSCSEDDTSKIAFNPNKPGSANGSTNDESEPPLSGDGKVSIHMATPYNSDLFQAQEEFTEDFGANGATTFDSSKWAAYDDDGFAAWSFKKENVSMGEDGGNNAVAGGDQVLKLTAKYIPEGYKRNNSSFTFYFTSGILRSLKPVHYGYYEARIKGSNVWPGTCSGFWLYTILDKDNVQPRALNTLVYNEIDIIEMQQVASDPHIMSSNMHLMYMADSGKKDAQGNTVFQYDWAKANKMKTIAGTEYKVDWNTGDDYHIYACENRPDSVVFYLDNKRVGGKPNLYWHMDEGMYLTLSLGIRTPYEMYDSNGVRQPKQPVAGDSQIAKFPTSQYIDYIRSWKRDYSNFRNNERKFDPNDMH